MSTKEQIKQMASDPTRGRELSAKMLLSKRDGSDVVISLDKKKITLKRVTEISRDNK